MSVPGGTGLSNAARRQRAGRAGDFFESLSGPGPFRGGGFTLRIACMKTASDSFRGSPRSSQRWETDFSCLNDHDFEAVEDPQGRLIAREPKNIRQVLELRGLWASTPQGERPVLLADPADERNVDLFKLDMVAAYRIAPFLDVGGGVASSASKWRKVPEGPATTVYRPVIVRSASPLRRWRFMIRRREYADTKLTELTPGSKARRVARIVWMWTTSPSVSPARVGGKTTSARLRTPRMETGFSPAG